MQQVGWIDVNFFTPPGQFGDLYTMWNEWSPQGLNMIIEFQDF